MDKRLNQIQTGSLTDSRLNEDFVFWLKTKGLNYLLVVLLVGCGYMGWHWYQRVRSQSRADAWLRLERASTPQELAVVATEDGSVDSIALIAKLRSANAYLGSILRGVRFDREPTAEDAKITPELRKEWLENADMLFEDIATSLSAPNVAPALTPMAFHALMGRAAVAEARGDADATRAMLDAASKRATGSYAPLAEVAKKRVEKVELAALGAELPPRSAVPTAGPNLLPTVTPQMPGLQQPGLPGGVQGGNLPPGMIPVDPRDTGVIPFGRQTPPPAGGAPAPGGDAPAPPSGAPAPPPAQDPAPAPPPAPPKAP